MKYTDSVIDNFDDKLKPFFDKFEPLKKNYCVGCLGLEEVQPEFDTSESKTCDVYMMDTSICDSCGRTLDVVNPFVYSVYKMQNLNSFDGFGKIQRIYRSSQEEILWWGALNNAKKFAEENNIALKRTQGMLENYFSYMAINGINYELQYKEGQYRLILNNDKDFTAGTLWGVLEIAKKHIEKDRP